jgi:hypothetical protein
MKGCTPGAAAALAVATTLSTTQQQIIVYEFDVGVLVDEDVLAVPVRAAEEEIVQRRLCERARKSESARE